MTRLPWWVTVAALAVTHLGAVAAVIALWHLTGQGVRYQ